MQSFIDDLTHPSCCSNMMAVVSNIKMSSLKCLEEILMLIKRTTSFGGSVYCHHMVVCYLHTIIFKAYMFKLNH